ncbi:hypothetical protein EV182_002560, partial [Spiromyces aspiralis]
VAAGLVAAAAVYVSATIHPLLTGLSLVVSLLAFLLHRLRYHYDSNARLYEPDNVRFESTGQVSFASSAATKRLTSEASTESLAFDRTKFESQIDFNRYGLVVDGKPVLLVAADFDYWHMANGHLGTWRAALLHFKALGVNAVRIRFHWGYHSSAPGKYNFEGDHDVAKLLLLCSELGLYVIAVVGPYIGEDIQAGGYPHWLVQNRSIRLRHMWVSGWKRFCPKFAFLSRQWYSEILPRIQPFQITEADGEGRRPAGSSGGCVVLVQLENQLYDRLGQRGVPLCLRDEMRFLAYTARSMGITVPLLANNRKTTDLVEGTWGRVYAGLESYLRKLRLLPPDFHVDIEGYVLFSNTLRNGKPPALLHQIRADDSPFVINEIDRTESSTYDLPLELGISLALGSTVVSLSQLMPTLFRDIFCSLHVRELPEKHSVVNDTLEVTPHGHHTRLLVYLVRSFSQFLARTNDLHERPWINRPSILAARSLVISGAEPTYSAVRRSLDVDSSVEDLTLVAFISPEKVPDPKQRQAFSIGYVLADDPINARPLVTLEGTVSRGGSFVVVLANYDVMTNPRAPPLRLLGSTKPIYLRQTVALESGHMTSEIWIVPHESVQHGQMAFVGKVDVLGEASVEYLTDGDSSKAAAESGDDTNVLFSIVEFKDNATLVQVTSASQCVYIVLLDNPALETVVADIDDASGRARAIAWGPPNATFDGGRVRVPRSKTDQQLVLISSGNRGETVAAVEGFRPAGGETTRYSALPFIREYKRAGDKPSIRVAHDRAETRVTNWNDYKWKLIPTYTDIESMDDIHAMPYSRDLGSFAFLAQDLTFSSGHTVYRGIVHLNHRHITDDRIYLQLNGRHRCTVFFNGHNISGHTTFSADLLKPGAYRGPDFRLDVHTYDITDHAFIGQDDESLRNEVIVLVESFGLGSQARLLNDARTPRGLITAHWHGFNLAIGHRQDDSEVDLSNEDQDPRTTELKAPWDMVG